jgi:hypothetical protein
MDIQDIKTTQHSQIIKKKNFLTITISILLIIAGIVTFSVSSGADKDKSSLAMALFFGAICLIATGIVLFLTKWQYNVYEKTGSPVKFQTYAFSKKEINALKDILAQGKFEGRKSISFAPNGDGHLDIIYSNDNQFVAAQIKEFIPFSFQAVTPVYYFYESVAADFINYLK